MIVFYKLFIYLFISPFQVQSSIFFLMITLQNRLVAYDINIIFYYNITQNFINIYCININSKLYNCLLGF